jgi:hypothetical protein
MADQGIDLAEFSEAGEIIEFEVMIRPIEALGEERWNRIGLRPPKPAAGGGLKPRL